MISFLDRVFKFWQMAMFQPEKLRGWLNRKTQVSGENSNYLIFWPGQALLAKQDYDQNLGLNIVSLIFIFSIPYILINSISLNFTSLIFLPAIWLTSYIVSIYCLPLGIHFPLFFVSSFLINYSEVWTIKPELFYLNALSSIYSFNIILMIFSFIITVYALLNKVLLNFNNHALERNFNTGIKTILLFGSLATFLIQRNYFIYTLIIIFFLGHPSSNSNFESQYRFKQHSPNRYSFGLALRKIYTKLKLISLLIFPLSLIISIWIGWKISINPESTILIYQAILFITFLSLILNAAICVNTSINLGITFTKSFGLYLGSLRILALVFISNVGGLFIGFVCSLVIPIIAITISSIDLIPQSLELFLCLIIGFILSPTIDIARNIEFSRFEQTEDHESNKEDFSLWALGWFFYIYIFCGTYLVSFGLSYFRIESIKLPLFPIALLISLIGYFRLFPDSLIYLWLFRSSRISSKDPFLLLEKLPPNSHSLLCHEIPGHSEIIKRAFSKDASRAIKIYEIAVETGLKNARSAYYKASPKLILNEFSKVKTIDEIINISNPKHPILGVLAPSLYTEKSWRLQILEITDQIIFAHEVPTDFELYLYPDDYSSYFSKKPTRTVEIYTIFLYLREISEDIAEALESKQSGLRARRLEPILKTLTKLRDLMSLKNEDTSKLIDTWINILRNELKKLKSESAGEIINPFEYGRPLHTDRSKLFKGRQSLVDMLVRLMLDSNQLTIVLHGPRRFGKTSFLLNLARLTRSISHDILPVYLDVQRSSVTANDGDFLYGMVRAIYRDIKKQGINIQTYPKRSDFQSNPYLVTEEWLENILSLMPEKRLIITIDEFEKLGSSIREGRLSLNLLGEIRSLIQHWDQLSFLFSGVQTLDDLGPNWSDYFISVIPVEITYLEPEEVRDLLRNPDDTFPLTYEPGIIDKIIEVTHCHPYLVQLLGSSLVVSANLAETHEVNFHLLQRAIDKALISGEPYFKNIWLEFTGVSSKQVKAGQKILSNLAKEIQPVNHLSNPDFQEALARLKQYHIINTKSDKYTFEVPFIELWVQKNIET